MASSLCLRCLRRSLRSIGPSVLIRAAPFSTTPTALAVAKASTNKKAVVGKPAAGGKGKRLHLTKNKRASTGRPPAPGERKAVRKRIVLSNTNALEVPGLQHLTVDKLVRLNEGHVALDEYRGQVLALTDDTLDALRALEAFKPTQGWSLFRRPATLVRKETAELAREVAIMAPGRAASRTVVFGEKGSGKSVLLLQAQALALLRGCIVMHFPEAQDLINGQTSYQPVDAPEGTVYTQPQFTAKLLTNLAAANRALLEGLRLSRQHALPVPVQSNISLARFAEIGARDPDLAWPVWQALWAELTAPSQETAEGLQRPPLFVSMDGVDQAMRLSAYLDADAKPIHAHDLALVRHFVRLLSGETALPNGGMVLAATCASNRAAAPTLEHHLNLSHARQHNSSSPSSPLPLPEWNSYLPKDARVDAAMREVQSLRLQGLSKAEARGVMEYYARSGMLRQNVTDGLVSEKWMLAGSGIIGELEKGSARARF